MLLIPSIEEVLDSSTELAFEFSNNSKYLSFNNTSALWASLLALIKAFFAQASSQSNFCLLALLIILPSFVSGITRLLALAAAEEISDARSASVFFV